MPRKHNSTETGTVVATNDDVVATNDDVVATNDDVVATNDDVVATNDDVVATNDDVVATNDDVDDDSDDDSDIVDDDVLDQTNDRGLTKPAITRLARRAGVKSMSDDCVVPIRNLIAMKLDEIMSTTITVNTQHTTKTIMADDVYEALSFTGVNVARTVDF